MVNHQDIFSSIILAQSLVIVESRAKAKTLFKYLRCIYQVITSVGYLKDLYMNKLGSNIEHDFNDSVANDRFVIVATGFHVELS